jgi:hypothetical protein
MARAAFFVVERWISAARVLMGHMTSGTGQLAGRETLALHQTKRLKTDVLNLGVIDWRLIAMAVSAEVDLLGSRELPGIEHLRTGPGMLLRSKMAAVALYARSDRLQIPCDR